MSRIMLIYATNRTPGRSVNSRITKEDILEKTSELNIFKKYLGDIKIGSVIKNPTREDNHPSLGIFVSNRDNSLLYKDLATGDCGDVFKFVKKMYGLSRYSDVYERIYSDMSISSIIHKESYLDATRYKVSKNKEISIRRKEFSVNDIKFWNSYGISLDTLKKYNVYSISNYFVEGVPQHVVTDDEIMFAYKVFNKFKIYRPISPRNLKWRGNLGSMDIQGAEQLPDNGDILIITKSLKDVMVLHELGFNSVAPPSESSMIPENVMENLKGRFKKIIIFYDRDKTGLSFTRKLVKKYGLDFMFINKRFNKKDISDFIKSYGKEETIKFLDKIKTPQSINKIIVSEKSSSD